MSNNVPITAGSGTTIAADDCAGVQYQRVKLVNGTEDATDAIPGEATNGLDVDVTRVQGNVAVTLAAGATSIAKAEDVASADADVGSPAMAVRKATPANTSGTDGDYEFLQMSAGRLWASATIDAALPAGTNVIGKVSIDQTTPGTTNLVSVGGPVAQDAAISGNPANIGFRASNAIPTAMSADGDAVFAWGNLRGMQVVTSVPGAGLNSDPFNQKFAGAQYTTTQTSTTLLTPTAGKKLCVMSMQCQVGGTTAGNAQLYFGTGAFSRGTTRTILDGDFAPSTTQKPGVVMNGPFWAGAADDLLRVTTSAAITITFSIWFYEA